MSWSGGVYTRTNGTYTGSTVWASDEAAAVDIESTRHDTHDQDLATGINNCLTKDGQNAATANLPMGGFLHTNVANATARTNYGVVGQIQDSAYVWGGTAAGTANDITITLSPAISSYTTGIRVHFKSNGTNTSTTPTLNVNSVAIKTIKRADGSALLPGDITTGNICEMVYDGTNFLLLNPYHGPGTYTPSYGAAASMTFGSVTTSIGMYHKINRLCFVQIYFNGTTGGTASSYITFTLPFDAYGHSAAPFIPCYIEDGAGGSQAGLIYIPTSGTTARLYKVTLANWGLGAGRYGVGNFWYFTNA